MLASAILKTRFLVLLLLLCSSCNKREIIRGSKILTDFDDPLNCWIKEQEWKRESDSIKLRYPTFNMDQRSLALSALSNIALPADLPFLVALINKKEEPILPAINAIGQLGLSQSIKPLHSSLESGFESRFNSALIVALAKSIKTEEQFVKNAEILDQHGSKLSYAKALYYVSLNLPNSQSVHDAIIKRIRTSSDTTQIILLQGLSRMKTTLEETAILNPLLEGSPDDYQMSLIVKILKKASTNDILRIAPRILNNAGYHFSKIELYRLFKSLSYDSCKYFIRGQFENERNSIRQAELLDAIMEHKNNASVFAFLNLENMDSYDLPNQAKVLHIMLSSKDHKAEALEEINMRFAESSSLLETAHLVDALIDADQFTIKDFQNLEHDVQFIRTRAYKRLLYYEMANENFNSVNKLLELAIEHLDPAMLSIAAIFCKTQEELDVTVPARALISSIEKLNAQKDIEAILEIEAMADALSMPFPLRNSRMSFPRVDFKELSRLKTNPIVHIQTSKGPIVIELLVDMAPASVYRFMQLMQDSSYANRIIHRVVNNFVIQAGCPRGDGWGMENFFIPGEYCDGEFHRGSVGIASAGKDTESGQWFITHTATPHLNGRYTKLGRVVKGMEVVDQARVGDKVEAYAVDLEYKSQD